MSPVKDVPNLPDKAAPGFPGNIDESQEKTLRQFWKEVLGWVQQSSGVDPDAEAGDGSRGQKGADQNEPSDQKDDAAREAELAKIEGQNVHALLSTYSGKEIQEAIWDMAKFEDADSVFCRFLRARKWDLLRSLGMFAGALKWRLDFDVESILRAGDEGNKHLPNWEDQETSGKVFTYGATQKEQLMIYITVRKHLTSGQPDSTMEKYIVYAMETYRLLMQPPAMCVSLVFNLEGFGMKSMDWHTVKFVVSILEQYYPECLGTLYVMHAPWIFNGIWKALAPMLDPVVRAKVQFIKRIPDAASNLPEDRVPQCFGGTSKYEYEYTKSQPGENKLLENKEECEKRRKIRNDHWIELQKATQKWIESEDKSIADQRRLLNKKIRAAHFDYEPYYRGATLSDRKGLTLRDGRVTWFYHPEDGEDMRHVLGRARCTPTLRREIRDVEEGHVSVSEAESRTAQALENQDWAALYGSEEKAAEVEGVEFVSKSNKSSSSAGQSPDDTGSPSKKDAAVGAATGAGVGTGTGAAALAAATASRSDGSKPAASATASTEGTGEKDDAEQRSVLRRVNSLSSNQSLETFEDTTADLDQAPIAGGKGTTTYTVDDGTSQSRKHTSDNPSPQPDGSGEKASSISSSYNTQGEGSPSHTLGEGSPSPSASPGDHGSGSSSKSERTLNPFRRDHHPHLHKLTHKVARKLHIDPK